MFSKKNFEVWWIPGALVCATLALFVFISKYRWFWNDEAVTVMLAFDWPWIDYFRGVTGEVNTAPLYYLAMKAMTSAQPSVGALGFDSVLFFRAIGILPMIAALLYLYFFARPRLGWMLAASVSFVFIAGAQSQEYGFQARQYALWALFAMIHAKMILEVGIEEATEIKWTALFCASALLCLTTPIGLIQVFASGLFLLLCRIPIGGLIRYAVMTAPLAAYAVYCKSNVVPVYFTWPGLSEMGHLVLANARWWMVGLIAACLPLMGNRQKQLALLKYLLALALIVSVLIFFVWMNRHQKSWYIVANRYFFFLYAVLPVVMVFSLAASLKKLREPMRIRARLILSLVFLCMGSYFIANNVFHLSSSSHLYGDIVQSDLKPALETAKERCICVDPDFDKTNPAAWVQHMLELRSHNAKSPSCADPLRIRFDYRKGEDYRVAVRLIEGSQRPAVFSGSSAFCRAD